MYIFFIFFIYVRIKKPSKSLRKQKQIRNNLRAIFNDNPKKKFIFLRNPTNHFFDIYVYII